MNKIVNIKTKQPYDLYIGRFNQNYGVSDSIFKNPFVIGKDGDRKEVIQKFKEYAYKNQKILDNLYLVDNRVLGCWCNFPEEDCHGRILIELREQQVAFEKQTGGVEKENKPKKYKLAVIGSRGVTQYTPIYKFLDDRIDRIEMIVSGGCKNSPDEIAHEWCKNRGVPILIFYPDWEGKGKSAGFQRNKRIIESADNVVAFYDGESKGTANSISIAKGLKKPCKVIVMKPGNQEIIND